MHGGFMKWIGHAAWLVTALISINVGLAPFGFNFFQTEFMMMNPQFVEPICYIVLASGLWSLVYFVMKISRGSGKCTAKSKCGC